MRTKETARVQCTRLHGVRVQGRQLGWSHGRYSIHTAHHRRNRTAKVKKRKTNNVANIFYVRCSAPKKSKHTHTHSLSERRIAGHGWEWWNVLQATTRLCRAKFQLRTHTCVRKNTESIYLSAFARLCIGISEYFSCSFYKTPIDIKLAYAAHFRRNEIFIAQHIDCGITEMNFARAIL